MTAVVAIALLTLSCDSRNEHSAVMPDTAETARASLMPGEGTAYDFGATRTACVDDIVFDSTYIGRSSFHPFAWDTPEDLKQQIEHRGFEWLDDLDLSFLRTTPVSERGLKYAVLARLEVSEVDATTGSTDCDRVFVGSEQCGKAVFESGVRNHVVLFRSYEAFDQIVQLAEVESFASASSALKPLDRGSALAVELTDAGGDVEAVLNAAPSYADGWMDLVSQSQAAANDAAVNPLDGVLAPIELSAYDVSACSPSDTAACSIKFGPIAVEAHRRVSRLAAATLPNERIWRYPDLTAAGEWLSASEAARRCVNEIESAARACELDCARCALPACAESLEEPADLPPVDFKLDYLFEYPETIRTSRRHNVLAAARDQFCWLAGIQGSFAGSAEEVSVTVSDIGRWVASTRSRQEDRVTAFVTCRPWSAFAGYKGPKAPPVTFHTLEAGEAMEFEEPGTVLALMAVRGGLQSLGDGFDIEQNPDGGGRAEVFGRTSIRIAEVPVVADGVSMEFEVFELQGSFNEEIPNSRSSGDRRACFPGRIRGNFASTSEKMFVGAWPEVGRVAIGSGCDEGLFGGCDNNNYRRISAAANCLNLLVQEAP